MADHSLIEWTDATWNPITGCSVVSPGCTNCYAMRLAGTRLKHHPSRAGLTIDAKSGPVWNGKVRLNREWTAQPLSWKRRRMIFVCAHGDLFHEDVPDEWLDSVFAVMDRARHHTFQVLTKRAERMRDYMRHRYELPDYIMDFYRDEDGSGPERGWQPPKNVWLGVSVEDQQRADERVPYLLETPAAVRFVSAEPLLGPIELRDIHDGVDCLSRRTGARLDWVIVGGESGDGARPMHPDWARSLRDQCLSADVPFFFKQWGSWLPVPNARRLSYSMEHGRVVCREWQEEVSFLVGKKAAGRLLDGIEHNGLPRVRP